MISKTLNTAVMFCNPNLGFEAKDVYGHSLLSTGAMALLCVSVENNIINMIGRWRSNEMLRYLHEQAEPLTSKFS